MPIHRTRTKSLLVLSQIRLNEDTIQDVVQAADLLLLTDLKALCCEFLEGCIAAENCIGIRDFALHYCLHHVHYLATEYLETHFRDVSSTEEFLELSPQKLKEVISLEKLNVGNERYVFEAVIRWIAHDVEMRKVPALRAWPWASFSRDGWGCGLWLKPSVSDYEQGSFWATQTVQRNTPNAGSPRASSVQGLGTERTQRPTLYP